MCTCTGCMFERRRWGTVTTMTAMRLSVFATACVTGWIEESARKAHLDGGEESGRRGW